MKILFVSNLFPPEYVGGYELRCAQVARELVRTGHDVRVVTSEAKVTPVEQESAKVRDGEYSGIDVERWLGHYRQRPPRGWPYTLAFARRQMLDVMRFQRTLEEFRPDVVAWWNLAGLTKALLPLPAARGIPDLCFVEDSWMQTEFGASGEVDAFHWFDFWRGEWGPALARPAVRLALSRWRRQAEAEGIPTRPFRLAPSHVCFVSEFLRFEHARAGLDLRSTEVIYGGVHVERFRTERSRSEFAERPLKVLYVGYLSRDRGLHTLIDAIDLLPPELKERVRLSVVYGAPVGETNYSLEVKRKVRDLRLEVQIRFRGRVPHEAMPSVYRAHQLLVCPSNRGEGLPLSMVEAMASGAGVITTGSGGAIELADRAGLPIFPPEHPVALSRLISRLYQAPALLAETALRGQQVALREFNLDRMMSDLLRRLEILVRGEEESPVGEAVSTASHVRANLQ